MIGAHTFGGPLIQMSKCHLGIPDDPSFLDVTRILNFLQETPHIRWITRNIAEIERLRGTPGEPIPVKEPVYTTKLRWLDSFLDVDMTSTSTTATMTYTFTKDCADAGLA